MTMTSAERVHAALERRIPDRVPVMELGIDPSIVKGLGFSGYAQMYEELNLDGIIISSLLDFPEGVELEIQEGKRVKNAWGVTLQYTKELVAIPVDHPVKSLEDWSKYSPPDPTIPGNQLRRMGEIVRRYKGKRAVIAHSREVFGDSWYLRGMEEYMIDLLTHPELVIQIANVVVAHNKERARQLIQAGVEIIQLGDDYAYNAGPFMSPRLFRTFLLPGMTEVVRYIKQLGAYVIKHTDGNIWPIIEPIVATGIDCLGPLEPGAGMDLFEVKRQFGDRVCVMGNVDVDLLSRGSIEDVKQETARQIERCAPGGGYILSSGNTLSSSVQPENFAAMIETARNLGGAQIQQ